MVHMQYIRIYHVILKLLKDLSFILAMSWFVVLPKPPVTGRYIVRFHMGMGRNLFLPLVDPKTLNVYRCSSQNHS